MGVIVPKEYGTLVEAAAKALGLPVAVVAEQIATESSWNPNAVSPTGAQGIAQFEPGTWSTWGHGSPFDPTAAFAAYTAYMGHLLKQEGGDVRKALAAYNAGPGNLAAGYGYADGILKQAGANNITVSGGGIIGGIEQTFQDITSGLITWPGDMIRFFSTATDSITRTSSFFSAFFQPSTYVRIASGGLGLVALIAGIVCLGLAAKDT